MKRPPGVQQTGKVGNFPHPALTNEQLPDSFRTPDELTVRRTPTSESSHTRDGGSAEAYPASTMELSLGCGAAEDGGSPYSD